MNKSVVHTDRSKWVLQVFHNPIIYTKKDRSFEQRKAYSGWKNTITSDSGVWHPDESRLILPSDFQGSDLPTSNLIVLNDWNREDKVPKDLEKIQFFRLSQAMKHYGIFRLRQIEDSIEVHLFYNEGYMGLPHRDNFKLCNLEPHIPVEIKVNGKLDHTLSSGAERTYYEWHYIMELVGSTDCIEFGKNPFQKSQKKIPRPVKVIDLMKDLY